VQAFADRLSASYVAVQQMGLGMPESDLPAREDELRYRNFGAWRGIVSAWAIAVFVVILFAGVQALASLYGVSPRQASLTHVVIPRHDPACAGPAVPGSGGDNQCRASAAPFDPAFVDAGW
jgi:hypothetical protein